MTATLGKIDLSLDGPRGPDVTHEVLVPALWFEEGRRIAVTVPGRLSCAGCGGGGCDACERRGAFDLPAASLPLEVTLPKGVDTPGVRIRFPGMGAEATEPDVMRGQLLLSIKVGEIPSRGVSVRMDQPIKPTRADIGMGLRIVIMAVLVTLLFVFLLRFSGWI